MIQYSSKLQLCSWQEAVWKKIFHAANQLMNIFLYAKFELCSAASLISIQAILIVAETCFCMLLLNYNCVLI